jgi:segregation and condensation protein A
VATPSLFDLELDLDAFSGPFDLLLALILREEVELVEVPVAAIVLTYAEGLDAAGEDLDLAAVSEFLVLVAALLAIKARLLVDGPADEEELDPEEAAAELAARLSEYRRYKTAAAWLDGRRRSLGPRHFRIGPAPLGPRRPPAQVPDEDRGDLAAALARLLEAPPELDAASIPRRHVPIRPFLERFRTLLAERGTFVFDDQVGSLDRAEQAAAFLALLELYKRGEIGVAQARAFAPIRVQGARQPALVREAVA